MSNFIPPHTQTAIRLLRLSLWFLPAIFLPLSFVLMRMIDGIPLLLTNIISSFPDDLDDHKSDQQKASARLVNRENSCCPGPVKLSETSQ